MLNSLNCNARIVSSSSDSKNNDDARDDSKSAHKYQDKQPWRHEKQCWLHIVTGLAGPSDSDSEQNFLERFQPEFGHAENTLLASELEEGCRVKIA